MLDGTDYRAGNTAVFVLWDERDPEPNVLIAPSAQPAREAARGHTRPR